MIIDGFPAGKDYYPHIASVQKDKSHHCGGAILSNQWIITAAHCITKGDPIKYSVRVGTIDRTKGDSYDIDLVLLHENFTWGNLEPPQNLLHNLALLRTVVPIKFSDHVRAASIAKAWDTEMPVYRGAGWGRTQPGIAELPLLLHEMYYGTLSNEECKSRMPSNAKGNIYPSSLCVKNSDHHRNFCRGDSGGPLLSVNSLVGIHSWGIGCERYPDVFTRVFDYKEWVDKMQKINFMLPPNSNCICQKIDRCSCEGRDGVFINARLVL